MKKVLLIILMALSSYGQVYSQITFVKNFGGNYDDHGNCVLQTTDGGYIISGETYLSSVQKKSYLVKTNAYGDTLWTRKFGNYSTANSVIQISDGGYVFTGTDYFGSNGDLLLVRTNSSGNTLWTKLIGDSYYEEGYSVIKTFDGGYAVAGRKVTDITNRAGVYLVKTDTGGNVVWTRTYRKFYNDEGYSLIQTNDSGFIIAGKSNTTSFSNQKAYVIRTNDVGDTLWTRTYGSNNLTSFNSLIKNVDGGVVIVGSNSNNGTGYDNQVYLIKINSNGDSIWSKTFGGIHSDIGRSITKSNDGGYVIAGNTTSISTDGDVFLLKTNANGDSLWSRIYGVDELDAAFSINATNDGGFIITGITYSYGSSDANVYLIKTDENGVITISGNHIKPYQNIKITPNPFTTSTQITLDQTYHNISLSVYDIQGKLMLQNQYAECNRIQLNRNGLNNGMYFLKLTLDDKEVETGKVVISE